MWGHCLLDVRVMRGTDVGSEHMLFREKLKVKIAKINSGRGETGREVQWLMSQKRKRVHQGIQK